MTQKLEIPDEAIQAINSAVKASLPQAVTDVVTDFVNQIRFHISPEQIRATAKELIDSEELRKEVSEQQVFLTLDLHEIQMANWADILKVTKEETEKNISLKAVEIKAEKEKIRLLREVQLAEVALNKAKAEEDWDIALLRFHKIKGHLFLGAVLLVIGIFLGQAIASFQQPQQAVHSVKKAAPKK